MKTVSQSYLMGIREGREYLKHFKPDLDAMQGVLANIKSTLRMGFSGEVGDMLRGERDFWINQIKKG